MPTIPSNRTAPLASDIAVQDALPLLGTSSREELKQVLTNTDADLAKLFEDRNILLVDGGLITYSGTTVSFSEALKLHVNSKIAGGSPTIIDLGSTTRTISASGRMIYAVIDRSLGTATITDDASTLPSVVAANLEVFLIAKRVDAADTTKRLYFRNGTTLNEGQTARLGFGGDLGSGTSSAVSWIANSQGISNGSDTVLVSFSSPQNDLSYVILPTIENTVDSNPLALQVISITKTVNGFTVKLSAPTDSGNYKLNYIIPLKAFPIVEFSVSSGVSSASPTFPIADNGSNYGLVAILQNLVDSSLQFQPLVITSKSSTGFTAKFNATTDSANYKLLYMKQATAEVAIGNGNNSISITNPVDYGNSNYAVFACMQNLTDANPQFQSLRISAKSGSGFTISFEDPTDSANYKISYYAISFSG